jgi:2-methylisocitrate lyase-like PEP mutase family enzyme
MTSATSKSARLRALFDRPETGLMPIGTLPIHAQMVQRAEFEAFELSGGMSAWWTAGVADVGLLTQTEVIALARTVANSVDIPVYCDADTGYGSAINTWRTTREFIKAGVAGIHLEDQAEPKKAGGQKGISLVSDEVMIGRLRAACDARDELDRDFVIVARTDGYGAAGGSLDEAIRRANVYKAETGADVIFFEGLDSWEDVQRANAETPGPSYAITSRKAGPVPSLERLTEIGQSINVANFVLPGVQEVWNLLLEVKAEMGLAPIDRYRSRLESFRGTPQFVGLGDVFVSPDYEQVRDMEGKYLPAEQQRDYS